MGAERSTAEEAEEAYRCAVTGDFRASRNCLEKLALDSSQSAKAWEFALAAQRWLAEPESGSLPTHEALEAFIDETPDVRRAAALACAEAGKGAILSHRITELEHWCTLQARLTDESDAWTTTWLKMHQAWLALAQGDVDQAESLSEQARVLGSNGSIAPAVIEATAIRALCAEHRGNIEEATSLARRGSRMARTEDLPQWQYLANLVLARMRRLNGLPHLTTRILQPLLSAAPAPWHGWIAWEALMAGALPLAQSTALTSVSDPAGEVATLREVLDAATKGDTRLLSKAVETCRVSTCWHSRRADSALAVAAIDATQDTRAAGGALHAWCIGDETATPNAVKGLCIDLETDPNDPSSAVFVVSGPTGEEEAPGPRRVAGLGQRLVKADKFIPRLRGTPERTLATLAAIALAGPKGITRQHLFKTVYGFDFDGELHRDLFKVLIYRVRKALGEVAEVESLPNDTYALRHQGILIVPDPRCEQSLEDRLLRALARRGAQSAREAAEQNGLPLRSTQRALKHLVENGALVVERVRNDVTYRVEDTTFSEPTKWS